MNRRLTKILTIICALFLSVNSVTAQNNETYPIFGEGFEMQWLKEPGKNIIAGHTYSYSLRIVNKTPLPKTVFVNFNTPEEWWSLSSLQTPTKLKSGDTLVALFSCKVRSNAKAGRYIFQFEVRNNKRQIIQKFDYEVGVLNNINLSIENIEKRQFVSSGSKFQIRYFLVNESNTPVHIDLSTKNTLIGLDTLTLESGAGKEITLEVKAPRAISNYTNLMYGFKAKIKKHDTTFTSFSSVKVFPEIIGSKRTRGQKHIFPVKISLNYLARENAGIYRNSLQGEVFATGGINSDLTDKLTISLRGPDQSQNSLFGNFEQYFVSYKNQNVKTIVGDHVASLTQLTEVGRYIRGITADVELNNFNISSFYGKARFSPVLNQEFGAKFDYHPSDNLRIGIASLVKDFASTDSTAFIPSVFGYYQNKRTKFETELALGRAGSQSSTAYKFRLTSKISKVSFNLGYIKAEKFFPGFLSNSQLVSLNVNYRYKQVVLGLNSNYRDANPSLDTIFVASPFSVNNNFNINYLTNTNHSFILRVGQIRRADRFDPKRFDYSEWFSRGEYKYFFNNSRANLVSFLQYGINTNFLIEQGDRTTNSYVTGLSLSTPLSYGLNISGGFNYINSERYENSRTSIFITRASLSYNRADKTYLSINYQSRYRVEDYLNAQDQFTFSLRQKLDENNILSITTRYAKPRGLSSEYNLFISAKYTYQFDMSKRRRKRPNTINGKVVQSDSTSVEGLIFKIGKKEALTEENGIFQFSRLENGVYFINVKRSSLSINKITKQKLPIKVEITNENPHPKIQIDIVDACQLHGQIKYPKIRNKLLDQNKAVYRPVYIEISNGSERHIQSCDSLGNFSFNYIRPGDWNIRMIESTLDENFIYNKTKTNVTLKPGDSKTLIFKARRKQKQLRMVSPPIKLSARIKTKDIEGSK